MAKRSKKRGRFNDQVGDDVKDQKKKGSSYGYLNLPKGVNVFKEPLDGTVKLDFLPYEVTNPKHADRKEATNRARPGDLWYKLPFRIHRGVGPEDETVVCPASFGKRCPICEIRIKKQKAGADQDELKPFNSSLRHLYCVIPIDSKDYEERPYVWDISAFCFQDELTDELSQDESNWGFFDLEEGLTLHVRLIKKAYSTVKYGFTKRILFKEREDEYEESILDDVPKLDDLLEVLSYEELDAKWLGMDEVENQEEDTDEDEVEKEVEQVPEPTTHRKRKKAKPVEEDEDEDEVDPDEIPFSKGDQVEWTYRGDLLAGEVKSIKGKFAIIIRDDNEKNTKVALDELGWFIQDDVEDEVEEKPKKTGKKAKKESLCPHGHEYGVDTDEKDECATCEVWEKCIDEKENAK